MEITPAAVVREMATARRRLANFMVGFLNYCPLSLAKALYSKVFSNVQVVFKIVQGCPEMFVYVE